MDSIGQKVCCSCFWIEKVASFEVKKLSHRFRNGNKEPSIWCSFFLRSTIRKFGDAVVIRAVGLLGGRAVIGRLLGPVVFDAAAGRGKQTQVKRSERDMHAKKKTKKQTAFPLCSDSAPRLPREQHGDRPRRMGTTFRRLQLDSKSGTRWRSSGWDRLGTKDRTRRVNNEKPASIFCVVEKQQRLLRISLCAWDG